PSALKQDKDLRRMAISPFFCWQCVGMPSISLYCQEISLTLPSLELAEAFQEGGCAKEDILAHCRQPGQHVRGGWVAGLILGKREVTEGNVTSGLALPK